MRRTSTGLHVQFIRHRLIEPKLLQLLPAAAPYRASSCALTMSGEEPKVELTTDEYAEGAEEVMTYQVRCFQETESGSWMPVTADAAKEKQPKKSTREEQKS